MEKVPGFSDEEIRILKSNPYTFSVSRNRFTLTLEGKKLVLELHKAGLNYRQIMEELGYEPEMLGLQRAKNLVRYTRREAESELGLHEGYARTARIRLSEEELEQLICNPTSYAKLKNEVIYLRKEVEFLKKISQRVISGKRGK